MRTAVSLLLVAAACSTAARPAPLAYPGARRGDTVDDYHGTRVADPYRWLEDLDSAETRAWVEAENKLTSAELDRNPWRRRFRERLEKIWQFERFGVPEEKGGRIVFKHNTGLQNQDVLLVLDRPDGEPRLLLDPNTLSADGTVALDEAELSEDGSLLAYSLREAGSDWQQWRVRRVADGADLPDVLRWAKFSSAAWSGDAKGFFYCAYDPPAPGTELTAPALGQKLYYHRLGTPQSDDQLVFARPGEPKWMFTPRTTDDGRFLVIHVERGTEPLNLVFVQDLTRRDAKPIALVNEWKAQYELAGSAGSRIYLRTTQDAPRGRVVAVDLAATPVWSEVVAQERATLKDANLVGDTLFLGYFEDAHSRVTLVDAAGKRLKDLELPGVGTVKGLLGGRGQRQTFYSFESFSTPPTIYRYDLEKGTSSVFRRPKIDVDPSQYETGLVFAKSKDGTRVPLFITHRKGIALDGRNPTYLYGYGGFDDFRVPAFSMTTIGWLEQGGVYVQAVLRGGGEYGEDWHRAGMLESKQNVFDDFIAAAEFLIADKITSKEKLAIGGGSNGGLLVGAVLNQRSDLFAAALPQVGVMDMLRYHKYTIGWSWAGEYGTSDDPGQWKTLFAYSPLHNIKPGTRYPAVLITTADHDDRVVPAHSFKYAAALQAAQAGPAPVLIRIESRAGHGSGKPVSKQLAEAADRLAFMAQALGLRPPG